MDHRSVPKMNTNPQKRFNFISFQVERALHSLFRFASHYETLLLLRSSPQIRRRATPINIHFTKIDEIVINSSPLYFEVDVSVALLQRWLFDCAVERDRKGHQTFAVLI